MVTHVYSLLSFGWEIFYVHGILLSNLSKIASMNIYSATRSPLPSKITDNAAHASLKLVVSANSKWSRGFCPCKSRAKKQRCIKIDLFGLRTSLSTQEAIPPPAAIPVTRHSLNNFSSHLLLRFFINPALSVLPKLTKT